MTSNQAFNWEGRNIDTILREAMIEANAMSPGPLKEHAKALIARKASRNGRELNFETLTISYKGSH